MSGNILGMIKTNGKTAGSAMQHGNTTLVQQTKRFASGHHDATGEYHLDDQSQRYSAGSAIRHGDMIGVRIRTKNQLVLQHVRAIPSGTTTRMDSPQINHHGCYVNFVSFVFIKDRN